MEFRPDDQAESLRKQVTIQSSKTSTLPPRSETHSIVEGKTKISISSQFPYMKLLLIFIVAVTVAGMWIKFAEQENSAKKPKEATGQSKETEQQDKVIDFQTSTDVNDNANTSVSEPTSEKNTDVETESKAPAKEETKETPTVPEENPVKSEPTKQQSYTQVKHVVQPNENLYRISLKYYGNKRGVDVIARWNGINPDDIKVGQTIIIPIPKKQ